MTSPTEPASVTIRAHGLRVRVVALGARIDSILLEEPGLELLYRTPWADAGGSEWGMSSSSALWHRDYAGGWHVLLPSAGDPDPRAPVEQPFHGEAAWRTWSLRQDGDTVVAEVLLRTVPVRVVRTVSVTEGRVTVDTVLRNVGTAATRLMWVEHPAFAGELFDDAELLVDGGAVGLASAPGSAFADLPVTTGTVELRSRSSGVGLRLGFDVTVHPRVFVWQERRGERGFPWWGAGDAVGLEPASDPYGDPADGFGSVRLAVGEERSTRFELDVDRLG